MPWRVGRELRPLFHALFSQTLRKRVLPTPTCLVIHPVHSALVAWASTATALHPHHPRSITQDAYVEMELLGVDANHASASVEAAMKRKLNVLPTPAKNVLSPLDRICHAVGALRSRYPQPEKPPMKHDITRVAGGSQLLPWFLEPERVTTLAQHLARSAQPRDALWLLATARRNGCELGPETYEALTREFISLHDWRLLYEAIKLTKNHRVPPTVELLNSCALALAKTHRFAGLDGILATFAAADLVPIRRTFHILVYAHVRNRDLPAARRYLSAMEDAGFPIDHSTYAIIMSAHRFLTVDDPLISRCLSALHQGDEKTGPTILNAMIKQMLDEHNMSGVIELLSLFANGPGDPSSDLGDTTTLLGGDHILDRSQPPRPRNKYRLNAQSYTILFNYLARRRDLPRAQQLLTRMRASHVDPDDFTAAALMRVYYSARRPHAALEVVANTLRKYPTPFSLLESLGYKPSASMDTILPSVATPSAEILNATMAGSLARYGFEGIHIVLFIMRSVGVQANRSTLRIIMSYLDQSGVRPGELVRLLHALMRTGVEPNLQDINLAMAAVLRQERTAVLSQGWAVPPRKRPLEPKDRQPAADEDPSATGIQFMPREQYQRLMRPILQSLEAHGVRADAASFAIRIKHEALVQGDLEQATRTFDQMLDIGIRPNEFHYGALMEGYAAASRLADAARVMADAAAAGVAVDVKTHTILIAGYARLGRPEKAMAAFRAMTASGTLPDVPAIDALVSAYFKTGAYGLARRLLLQLWPAVAPFPPELADAPLRELAVAFRALHDAQPPQEWLTADERLALRKKMNKVVNAWKATRKRRGGDKDERVSTGDSNEE